MTASAVTSTAEASASSPLQSVIQLTSENNNSNWKRSFHLDLAPSLPLPSSRDEYSSIGNDPELSRSSASSFLPPAPMFSSWSRLSHSSLHFLRGNTLASLSASNAGGPSPGSGTAKTSSATSNGVLTTVQSTSNLQRNAATAVELQGASATTSTTIPLHSANKTTTPAATATAATILTSSKRPVIIIYPTVSPESIVIPIVSCIFGFPLLALLVICCLRRRAKLARERERRRNYDMQDHAVSLITDRRELSACALSEALAEVSHH
ncbi:unnamed protein product [Hermetia illucens]|uniref:Uncharacterized protein n=1 Tax=Hermetia illucens TaxID=343691 RepID=A0A7R8YVV2_HERIL|nr:spore coat protein SP96 isoform X2 [Hermetia illucens]CAD7087728.1 unnamed protein product [Hermetia illucens]